MKKKLNQTKSTNKMNENSKKIELIECIAMHSASSISIYLSNHQVI